MNSTFKVVCHYISKNRVSKARSILRVIVTKRNAVKHKNQLSHMFTNTYLWRNMSQNLQVILTTRQQLLKQATKGTFKSVGAHRSWKCVGTIHEKASGIERHFGVAIRMKWVNQQNTIYSSLSLCDYTSIYRLATSYLIRKQFNMKKTITQSI